MKKEIKGFICGVATCAVLTGIVSYAAGEWKNIQVLSNDIKVVVEGKQITADNFLYNDTTYLPMRAIGEALGKDVSYDGNTNTAYIGERKDGDIGLNTGEAKNKYIPSEDIINQYDIRLRDGIYYAPIGYIATVSENNGYDSNYNESAGIGIFSVNNGNTTLFTIQDGDDNGGVIVDDRLCIPYDYFVEKILPLIS